MGGGTPSTSKSEYWNGDIDWYAPAEIADQIYVSSSQKKITQAGYDNSSAKMLPVGTVLFTSRAGIGKTAILAQKGCTNQGFQSIVPHEGQLDSYFIFSRTDELKKYGETTGAGSTFVEVSGKQMARMELLMPPTLSEQQEIGRFFASLDSTITLHQRKLESMKLLKKSLLQKMFPKSGETVPEVRFPGFTDAWEQRKFAELANIRRGLTYKPNDVTDSGIRVLRSSNINEDSFIENADDVFVKESAVNISSVKDGDILITSANGSNRLVGKHAIISKAGQAVHGGFMLIASAYGNPYFLNASMSSSWYTNFVNMYVAGGNGAIGNLKKSDLENQVIRVPSEAEQLRIGQFFQSIDQTITLHQRKVEALQKLKKSLLQQMFV